VASFDGRTWKAYLDQEARERRDEILDHLEGNYDGPSDFLKQKLMEEAALSIDERIERKQSKLEDEKQDLQRLKRIKREREEQSQLRDKRELLEQKQKRLQEMDDEVMSAHDAYMAVFDKFEDKSNYDMKDHEFVKAKWDRICRMAESKVEETPDVEQLVKDVQRLQREISELNGGDDLDCFIDVEKTEEVRSQ
jgi:hypothetical protein